jgi:hypothetical protein
LSSKGPVMTIRSVAAALLLTTALTPVMAPAMAQAVSDQAIADFVDSHSATRLEKIARWEEGVCPSVTGLPANFIKFITKRVRDVATSVGAPVNADESCKTNINIVFTTSPQELLNTVRDKEPVRLGYWSNTAQADEMAKVKHDIQSWHATQTVDLRGRPLIDSRYAAQGNALTSNATSSTGMRIGDGLRSSFYNGLVVANPNRLGDAEIGALADHIAMLALAQPATLGVCQELPSILDMTNATCRKEAPVKGLTKADTGYLKGLYKLDSGASLRNQKDALASEVKQALAGS